MTGGIFKSLCILLAWIFDPAGRNVYANTVFLYLSQTLFITSICMTKGAASRSTALLKTGALIGILSGLLATSAILCLIYLKVRVVEHVIFQWFNYSLINGLFIGVAAGIIYGISVNDRIAAYFMVGPVVGALTLGSHYAASMIADMNAFIVWTMSLPVDISTLYRKLAIYPIEGVIQSVIVWSALALYEKLFRSGNL